MNQFFFIENKMLGAAERDWGFVHAQLQPPRGYSFFCPECSRLWANCPIDRRPSMVWTKGCPKHPSYPSEVPGSLWLDWDEDFTAALPDEVVKWEFQRHLDWIEKGENRGN